MRINFILPALGKSGGIDVVYKYAELLHARGHDIIIYKSIIACDMHRYNSILKNKVHQIYCTLKCMLQIRKEKTKNEFDKYIPFIDDSYIRDADVVIATAWPTAYSICKLNRGKGEKYYFIQDVEIWDNKIRGLESYKLPLNKIVISTWINNKLYEYLKIGPFPILNNGIDISVFNNSDKIYKPAGDKINCLMLNHSLEKKGIQCGLEAFKIAQQKYPKISLTMFGLCSNDNLPEYIKYYQEPNQKTLVELYSNSDVFIFPSLEEGWGLTPLEAMACKCAVVGTKTGFVLDVGRDKENLLISTPGDAEELANNIIKLIENNDFLVKISEEGYLTARRLNWMNSVIQLEKILSRCKEEV